MERFYKTKDPWGYETHPDDLYRKMRILNVLSENVPRGTMVFEKALDIGCGEGWITKDLPAREIYGYDLSDTAMSRLPENVVSIGEEFSEQKFDLVIATGVLYKQYDYEWIQEMIRKVATGIVLTCNIKSWEHNNLPNLIYQDEFKYREKFTERLAIYDLSAAQHREKPE